MDSDPPDSAVGDPPVVEAEAEAAAMDLVIVVTWSIDAPVDEAWVEYRADGESEWRIGVDDAPGRALLSGLEPDTEVSWRVVTEMEGIRREGQTALARTGAYPPEFPVWSSAADGEAGWDGFVTFAWNQGDAGRSGIMTLDGRGQPVWYHLMEGTFIPAVKVALDGRSVWFLSGEGALDTASTELVHVSLEGIELDRIPLPGGHHDFVLDADGSIVYLDNYLASWDRYRLLTDRLMRRAIDGTLTELWNAYPEITPVPDATWENRKGGGMVDWTHANGLAWDPTAELWLVTLYYDGAVRGIDPETHASRWVLGGADGTIDVAEPLGPVHAPQPWKDGFYLFANGALDSTSGGAYYRVDYEGRTAFRTGAWPHPSGLHTDVLGDLVVLPDDAAVATFGSLGEVVAWDGEGEVTTRLVPDQIVTVAQAAYTKTLWVEDQ